MVDGEMQSPHKSQKEVSDPITAPSSAAKRKPSEPSPDVRKRPRSSDAQTDWVVKHARLLKQLEVLLMLHASMSTWTW